MTKEITASKTGLELRSDSYIQSGDCAYHIIDDDQTFSVHGHAVPDSLSLPLRLNTRPSTWPSFIPEKSIDGVLAFQQREPLSSVSGYTSHSTSPCSTSVGLVNSPSENSNATLTPDSTVSSSSTELPSPFSSSTQSSTSENTIVCECGKRFRGKNHQYRQSNYKRHIRSVHNNSSVACPKCPNNYTRPDNLKKHLREIHEMPDSFWKRNFSKKAKSLCC